MSQYEKYLEEVRTTRKPLALRLKMAWWRVADFLRNPWGEWKFECKFRISYDKKYPKRYDT